MVNNPVKGCVVQGGIFTDGLKGCQARYLNPGEAWSHAPTTSSVIKAGWYPWMVRPSIRHMTKRNEGGHCMGGARYNTRDYRLPVGTVRWPDMERSTLPTKGAGSSQSSKDAWWGERDLLMGGTRGHHPNPRTPSGGLRLNGCDDAQHSPFVNGHGEVGASRW